MYAMKRICRVCLKQSLILENVLSLSEFQYPTTCIFKFVFSSNDSKPWIEVNFLEPKTISGIVTTGAGNKPEWVTSYQVYTSFDGVDFQPYTETPGSTVPMTFPGNTDQTGTVKNLFNRNIYGQFVRIYPQTFHGSHSMNFEVLGCNPSEPREVITTVAPGLVNGSTPTARPGLVSGETPTARPGLVSGQTPTAIPGLVSGQTPTARPGLVSGQTPTAMPGLVSGQTPTAHPGLNSGATPTAVPGLVSGQTPSAGPGQGTTVSVPGFIFGGPTFAPPFPNFEQPPRGNILFAVYIQL